MRLLGGVAIWLWLICLWVMLGDLWIPQKRWPRALRVASLFVGMSLQTLLGFAGLRLNPPRDLPRVDTGWSRWQLRRSRRSFEVVCPSILVPLSLRFLDPRLKLSPNAHAT